MDTYNQKKLAAKVAGVGTDRVILEPAFAEDIKEAITKADIRDLIKKGAIKVLPARSPSRLRAKLRHKQKRKGRRKGHGARRGTQATRQGKKRVWINKIRKLRAVLKELRLKKQLSSKTHRELYGKAKGGFFRDASHLRFYMEQNKLLGVKK
jgi:large subunit ribosomal protein L19e